MKVNLSTAPKLPTEIPRRQPTRQGNGGQSKRQGLGTGRPGLPRKETVGKRQKRNRSEKGIASPKRARPNPPSTANPMQPPAPEAEPRVDLKLQTLTGKGTKREAAIRLLSGGATDEPPNHKALMLFHQEMDEWKLLDHGLAAALQPIHANAMHVAENAENPIEVLQEIVDLHAISSGVENATQHMIGSMVRVVHERNTEEDEESQKNVRTTLDAVEEDLGTLQYSKYVEALEACGCDQCKACVKFDKDYDRFYDNLADEVGSQETPPKFSERPVHCVDVEMSALNLQARFHGLSSSSLLNAYYFAQSTATMTPPTLTTATPTAVRGCTIKYMGPYLRERKLQDPLPQSWRCERPTPQPSQLVRLDKRALHFYDGDSLEIFLTTSSAKDLKELVEPRKKLAVRMLGHDAPEMAFAVRIYKQSPENTTMHAVLTRHIGLESLRAIRQMVFEAKEIYLEVERNMDDQAMLMQDCYGRALANIWVENDLQEKENLAVKLASSGYTMSFYTKRVSTDIHMCMRQAIQQRKGMFNLPEEVFLHPFRPWDLRRRWKDLNSPPVEYTEYRHITNAPAHPVTEWKEAGNVSEEDNTAPVHEHTFHVKMVASDKYLEGRCFKAPSELAGAGNGLFIRPHGNIPEGTHLCLYASSTATKEELERSSRDYAIHISKSNKWYDGEVEDGNNLGRFANQPGVREALEKIVELSSLSNYAEFQDSEWRSVEEAMLQKCNAIYKEDKGQLIVVARKAIPASKVAHEICTSYGGMREYWLTAIAENPTKFPKEMAALVQWLLTSPDCNWSQQQRESWVQM